VTRLNLGRSISEKVYNVNPNDFDNKKCYEILINFLKSNLKIVSLTYTKCNYKYFNNMYLLTEAMKSNTNLSEFLGLGLPKSILSILEKNKKEDSHMFEIPEDIANIISVYRTAKKIY